MKTTQILRLFIITIGILFLFSCNKETKEQTIVGTWDVYQQRIVANNGDISFIDQNYTQTFNANGTWDQNNVILSGTPTYTYSGNTLIKSNTTFIVTWTKSNKEWDYSWDDGNMTLYLKK